MIDLEIIIKYNKFMDIILGQISSPEIDITYRKIIKSIALLHLARDMHRTDRIF